MISTSLRRRAFDSIKRHSIGIQAYIESHRGCHKEFPENTLYAFEKSIEYGCDSIELDIWLTMDKTPVVIHGNENGEIDYNKGLVEINKINFDELNINRNTFEYIPSLREVLELCKDKIFINIEIKDKSYETCLSIIVEMVDNYEMREQICISSFHHEYSYILDLIKFKNIEFGYLFNANDITLSSFEFGGKGTLNIYYKNVTEKLVEEAHKNEMGVMVYFGMTDDDNDEEYIKLFQCGVDVICSNNPKRAIYLRNMYYCS